jgi:hypothetical protein
MGAVTASDGPPLLVVAATAEERVAHEQMQELLHTESHGHCLWRLA